MLIVPSAKSYVVFPEKALLEQFHSGVWLACDHNVPENLAHRPCVDGSSVGKGATV